MTRPGPSAIAERIFRQHLHMAATDGRVFRRTVMDQIMAESGCTDSSAATQYNNVKKRLVNEIPAGLGRQPKVSPQANPDSGQPAVDEDDPSFGLDCWTVVELTGGEPWTVGRTRSYQTRGDASEDFDTSVTRWPSSSWVMIQGLGPISGTNYRLGAGEVEVNRYTGQSVVVTHEYLFEVQGGVHVVRASGRAEAVLAIEETHHDFRLTHVDGQPVDADF